LRPVGGERLAEAVEHRDRQAARIVGGLEHERRHGADEHGLRDAAFRLTVPGDIACRLAAAGGMADMDGVAQVEVPDDDGRVGGVGVHRVPFGDLRRAPVAAPVVRDDAKAVGCEEQHLRVPVVGGERPTVVEHDRLSVLRAPVLEEDLDAVWCGDEGHSGLPSSRWIASRWIDPFGAVVPTARRSPIVSGR
jgi:hypothetical protein